MATLNQIISEQAKLIGDAKKNLEAAQKKPPPANAPIVAKEALMADIKERVANLTAAKNDTIKQMDEQIAAYKNEIAALEKQIRRRETAHRQPRADANAAASPGPAISRHPALRRAPLMKRSVFRMATSGTCTTAWQSDEDMAAVQRWSGPRPPRRFRSRSSRGLSHLAVHRSMTALYHW